MQTNSWGTTNTDEQQQMLSYSKQLCGVAHFIVYRLSCSRSSSTACLNSRQNITVSFLCALFVCCLWNLFNHDSLLFLPRIRLTIRAFLLLVIVFGSSSGSDSWLFIALVLLLALVALGPVSILVLVLFSLSFRVLFLCFVFFLVVYQDLFIYQFLVLVLFWFLVLLLARIPVILFILFYFIGFNAAPGSVLFWFGLQWHLESVFGCGSGSFPGIGVRFRCFMWNSLRFRWWFWFLRQVLRSSWD